jgi:thiamine kinase-like enzyme
MSTDALLDRLRDALRTARSPWADAVLQPMADKGLAHHHVRLAGTGVIARLPKQSQMGLDAQANLDYQAACFQRASAAGAAPRLFGVLAPGDALPRGGLLVEEIIGRAVRLPGDLPAIARALAAIHALPLPAQREPLRDDADPLRALAQEIDVQALHLDAADLAPPSRARIDALLAALRARCDSAGRPARRLIAFDAHPGNFIVQDDGRAVLVDLEKARYSHPPLDLAHATLYTSTTWDVDVYAELDIDQIADTYACWADPAADARADIAWWLPLRAAMWLWSVTWCAKWRVLSPRAVRESSGGEDWSSAHSQDKLVAHVRERVDCYLSAPVIERIVDEFAALEQRFA